MTTSNNNLSNQFNNLFLDYQRIIDAEKIEDDLVIDEYRSSLNDLERRYIKSPPTRPRKITIPEIFLRSYDENFISDYLAYILDPTVNGIGIAPLATLLQNFIPEIQNPELDFVVIEREYDVGGGRIDFLLHIGESTILGIENKLYSPEGDQQTNYYARKIKHEFPDSDCFFIYLTPSGAKASSREFRSISYSQVWESLRSIQYDWQADLRKSVYWEDFLTHLEVYIMGQDKFEFSPRSKLYIENYQMLEDLRTSFDKDWRVLISFLESRLKIVLEDGDWSTGFNPTRYYYHIVRKRSWDYPDLFLHFEYLFSPTNLVNCEFYFMFEIEGKKANDYISVFENQFTGIKDFYDKKGIEYRPAARKHALAYKSYKFGSQPDSWEIEFITAFKEFSFLVEFIERALQDFKQLDSKSK